MRCWQAVTLAIGTVAVTAGCSQSLAPPAQPASDARSHRNASKGSLADGPSVRGSLRNEMPNKAGSTAPRSGETP